jgi:hypothetical protein
MDESGTHGSKTMLMAGFAGDVQQWRKFEKKAVRLFAKYGIEVFHAKEWRDGDGDFKGWTVDRKISFLDRFGEIANGTLMVGCHAVLKMADYHEFYVKNLDKPREPINTAYGVCFRAVLAFLSQVAAKANTDKEPARLDVVLERGHKNAGDALRIFELFKASLLPEWRHLLGTMTLATKNDCLPLAAPDAIALGQWRVEEGYARTMRARGRLRSEANYKNNHFRIGVEKDALLALRRELLPKGAQRLIR